jgi:hypothetical protein
MIFIAISNGETLGVQGQNYDFPLESKASTNPNSPLSLQEDIPIYDTLLNLSHHYYRTSPASESCFHVLWVNPYLHGGNPFLQLYADVGYSTLVLQTRPFYIIRPPTTQELNVDIVTSIGEAGDYYIGWENTSTELTSGNSVQGAVNIADMLDAYEVYLEKTKRYNITLAVPVGADFQLLVFFPNLTNYGYTLDMGIPINMSALPGNGVDEAILNWRPSVTGECVLVVMWESGVGTYELTFDCLNCPKIPINRAMIFIGIIMGVIIHVRNLKKPF